MMKILILFFISFNCHAEYFSKAMMVVRLEDCKDAPYILYRTEEECQAVPLTDCEELQETFNCELFSYKPTLQYDASKQGAYDERISTVNAVLLRIWTSDLHNQIQTYCEYHYNNKCKALTSQQKAEVISDFKLIHLAIPESELDAMLDR